jgi:alpha-tubulin suppressor-like RCC1 family protein
VSVSYTVCAIRLNDSFLFCWGHGANARLGTGSTANSATPTHVTGPLANTAVSLVSVSSGTVCATRANDSALFCWGLSNDGYLNDGYSYVQTLPVSITTSQLPAINSLCDNNNSSAAQCTCNSL